MVSKPSFDPNELAVHDTDLVNERYAALIDDPAAPLINRAINELNPPGSVFKLVVVAAALESGKYTPESTFPNPGDLHASRIHLGGDQLGRRHLWPGRNHDHRHGLATLLQHPDGRARTRTRRDRHPGAGREIRLQHRLRDPAHRVPERVPARDSTTRSSHCPHSDRATCSRRRFRWRWSRRRSPTMGCS